MRMPTKQIMSKPITKENIDEEINKTESFDPAKMAENTKGLKEELNKIFALDYANIFIQTLAKDTGMEVQKISDGYHTFEELYNFRLALCANLFRLWHWTEVWDESSALDVYDVHKSKLHHDGEKPFGSDDWFIIMAETVHGQISFHYQMKDWDLFQITEKEKANEWDGHTPRVALQRLFELAKPKEKE